jgi:hypothetical protein
LMNSSERFMVSSCVSHRRHDISVARHDISVARGTQRLFYQAGDGGFRGGGGPGLPGSRESPKTRHGRARLVLEGVHEFWKAFNGNAAELRGESCGLRIDLT